jgi:hypothetical protein
MKNLERKKYRNHDGKCGSKSQDFFGGVHFASWKGAGRVAKPVFKTLFAKMAPESIWTSLRFTTQKRMALPCHGWIPISFCQGFQCILNNRNTLVFPFYPFPTRKPLFRKPACNLALQPYHAIAKATLFQHEVYWPTRKTWTWKSSSTSLAFAQGFSASILPILPARWRMVRVSRFHDDCKCILYIILYSYVSLLLLLVRPPFLLLCAYWPLQQACRTLSRARGFFGLCRVRTLCLIKCQIEQRKQMPDRMSEYVSDRKQKGWGSNVR